MTTQVPFKKVNLPITVGPWRGAPGTTLSRARGPAITLSDGR